MKIKIYLVMLVLWMPAVCFGQLSGTVIDSATLAPLVGATVKLKGGAGTQTAGDGSFTLSVPGNAGTLVISYVGYGAREFGFSDLGVRAYRLSAMGGAFREVLVATGYQELPAERATGSFVTVDNALLNRSVSPDILSRLSDVTSGLIFNRNVPGRVNDITIRGQSTLFSNAQPLIVLDNFPYDGDLGNINPNDVQSVTVLKDAAAAS